MNPVYITEGDFTGISYEILSKSIDGLNKLAKKRNVLLISSNPELVPKQFKEIDNLNNIKKGLYVYYISKLEKTNIQIGKPSILSGISAFKSLDTAIQFQKKYGGDMITLPLSKEWVIKSGIKSFTGHTEYLALSYKRDTYMMMASNLFNVIPLTTHIPLINVSDQIKKINIKTLFNSIQQSKYLRNPKIAFCGLNPHAGEGGKIGNEEQSILKPMIAKLRKLGLNIQGPISADSVFTKECLKKYDLIFSCYHDQGLIPFKSIVGKKGINMTLGLDFVRVSPDHGTAFDIAGKGIASAESVLECIKIIQKIN